MEILLWLLPAAALTLASMAWVAWWGRESRTAITHESREEAARRLGEALSREPRSKPGYAAPRPAPQRASGVAVRTSRMRPVVIPGSVEGAEARDAGARDAADGRRAS
ncbi:hypothetical protein JK386_16700 [Nocardioides sp. zg-536]|uniref:Uncharacterized protein n=1 Tax=Nocardioides faecalis TaxID=2803858 RepID=A0A939BWY2_9ACTN|nr:hypothetical protein [Nocardioides faecalis]MBM9461546.1 hypothetical protein [Nocardioides faecalis]MBS4752544.1 hypothetical protein [Nocardioides faecalis]QVI57829.1 hypothetical protein KG111_12265 [Nocardioides faecalis]